MSDVSLTFQKQQKYGLAVHVYESLLRGPTIMGPICLEPSIVTTVITDSQVSWVLTVLSDQDQAKAYAKTRKNLLRKNVDQPNPTCELKDWQWWWIEPEGEILWSELSHLK